MKGRKEYTAPVFIGQNLYIKPSYIVSIPEFYRSDGSAPSLKFIENQENLKDNDQKGKLSRKAITQLRNSINWLCLAAKRKRVYVRAKQTSFEFKVNFVTLTLPDTTAPIGNQDLQKNLLNPFLTYMRKFHNLRNYVWRLEFQANGKLHVHLSADTFLHYQVIRDTWNRLLDKNGYLDEFFKENKHKDPNSTDVHATRKIKNMAAYLAKYMSKQGAEYRYPLKEISDKISACLEAGIGEKAISKLIDQKKKLMNAPARRLGVMDRKAWYFQRVNFWNSPFNPRPIKGRIWGCSAELSKANKLAVHIPANECAQDLRCLMAKDIPYKEIFSKPPETIHAKFAPDDIRNQPQKIGEVYFLNAVDWFNKINGSIRRAFEQTRAQITAMDQTLTFELL
jgi:hypothetical protein